MCSVGCILLWILSLFWGPAGSLGYLLTGLALLIFYSVLSFWLGLRVAFSPFYVPSDKAEAHWKDFSAEFAGARKRLLRYVSASTVSAWIGLGILALVGSSLWAASLGSGDTPLQTAVASGVLVAVVVIPAFAFAIFTRRALKEQSYLEEWGKMRVGPRD
jgi:hypothetical protein